MFKKIYSVDVESFNEAKGEMSLAGADQTFFFDLDDAKRCFKETVMNEKGDTCISLEEYELVLDDSLNITDMSAKDLLDEADRYENDIVDSTFKLNQIHANGCIYKVVDEIPQEELFPTTKLVGYEKAKESVWYASDYSLFKAFYLPEDSEEGDEPDEEYFAIFSKQV